VRGKKLPSGKKKIGKSRFEGYLSAKANSDTAMPLVLCFRDESGLEIVRV
jgi:hypothetical protein